MFFGGWVGDLRGLYFAGEFFNFLKCGYCVWTVDFVYIFFSWLLALNFSLLYSLLHLYEFLFDVFWLSIGFSAASETSANHLVPIRLICRRELCNYLVHCCFNGFTLRAKGLLSHVGLYYPFIKRSHFVYTSLQRNDSLFRICHKIF